MSLDTGDDTILIPISVWQFPSVSHKPCARTYGEQIVLGDVLDGRAVNLMGVEQGPQTILEHALQVLGVLVALGCVLANLRLVVALGLDEKRPLVSPWAFSTWKCSLSSPVVFAAVFGPAFAFLLAFNGDVFSCNLVLLGLLGPLSSSSL